MEGTGQILEVERNPVRLVVDGSALEHARERGHLAQQRQLGRSTSSAKLASAGGPAGSPNPSSAALRNTEQIRACAYWT